MKQTEYHGFDSIRNLAGILEQEKTKNVFLVTGGRSYETCGAQDAIEEQLSGGSFTRFCDFTPNPKIEEIKKGLKEFGEKDYDMIVGVGGGSSIDVAKAIKMFHCEKGGKNIPLVAIPTTAGSGSKATYFIVYYVGKQKQSAGRVDLTLPNYAICNPKLTMSLPKGIAASTGIDALGQAMESYWSINSTLESQGKAENAIRILMGNLEENVNFPTRESRRRVMRAANLSGKAINLTKTAACHSVAYPITSYFGIPHGHAVGLTLGEMLVFNSQVKDRDCNDERGVEYVRRTMDKLVRMLGALNPEEARDKIKCLMENIGLATKLSELGIDKEGVGVIVKNGFTPERVKNNPKVLTEDGLRGVLERIL